MKGYRFTKTALLMSVTVLTLFLMTACGNRQETGSGNTKPEAAENVTQAEGDPQDPAVTDESETILQDYVGEMDLAGSWDDEVSQRASMDVTRNDDGSYDILVHWGSGATETSFWQIHGTYDETSGMLSYEDGAYSVHIWDENDNETVTDEKTTKGAFMKEGEKLRWSDSLNSDDGLFVKVQ